MWNPTTIIFYFKANHQKDLKSERLRTTLVYIHDLKTGNKPKFVEYNDQQFRKCSEIPQIKRGFLKYVTGLI